MTTRSLKLSHSLVSGLDMRIDSVITTYLVESVQNLSFGLSEQFQHLSSVKQFNLPEND